MAAQTLAFTEVKHFDTRELNQLKKKTYAEICSQINTIFCVTEEKTRRFSDMYEEIIPYSQRITTADGIDVFVAKIKRHLICTEQSLYSIMREHYSAIDECYRDVTAMGGEYFEKLSFFNWAIETATPVKETSFRVPKMRAGSRLFYVAC